MPSPWQQIDMAGLIPATHPEKVDNDVAGRFVGQCGHVRLLVVIVEHNASDHPPESGSMVHLVGLVTNASEGRS